jgi:hypothetical protein
MSGRFSVLAALLLVVGVGTAAAQEDAPRTACQLAYAGESEARRDPAVSPDRLRFWQVQQRVTCGAVPNETPPAPVSRHAPPSRSSSADALQAAAELGYAIGAGPGGAGISSSTRAPFVSVPATQDADMNPSCVGLWVDYGRRLRICDEVGGGTTLLMWLREHRRLTLTVSER